MIFDISKEEYDFPQCEFVRTLVSFENYDNATTTVLKYLEDVLYDSEKLSLEEFWKRAANQFGRKVEEQKRTVGQEISQR